MTITEVDTLPTIRFADSDEPWVEHSLEALTAQPISYGVVQTGEHIEYGIPCVRVVDLTSDDLDLDTMIRTTTAISESYRRTVLEKDDVMMALRGEIGLVRSVPAELVGANLTRGVARIVADKRLVEPHFLLWSLQSPPTVSDIGQKVNGSALKEIPIGGLREVRIRLPRSKKEQQKIAAFLGAVDRKIQQLKRKQALLEQYKKGVVQQLFSQELRFKREEGSEYPEWEEKRLEDLCEVARSGGTPLSSVKEYYDGDIPFLSISDMTEQGKYLTKTRRTVSQAGIDNSSSWIVPANSLIYSMYASVGFVSINKIPLATSQAVMNLILKPGINIDFVYYQLNNLRSTLRKFIETGTQGNMTGESVKSLTLLMPSLEEQTRIAGFLMALDAKVAGVSRAVEAAQKWKKGLLQQMFV